MAVKVISLDIATKTGWAFCFDSGFEYGLINTSEKLSEAGKLAYFRIELEKLLLKYKPQYVVMEDIYSGKNIKVMKLLAKFAGVAEECCMSTCAIDPYIIHTNTVKAYFKVKTKRQLFDFALDIFDWGTKEFNFKKHNDIVDAICQSICFCDKILKIKKFREQKDYGYLYGV